MRKHLYGFALFAFIVASAAAVYAFIHTPNFIAEEVRLESSVPAPIEKIPDIDPLTYELKSFNIDLEKGIGTVEMKLNWNVGDKPPAGIRFDFGVAISGKPYAGTQVGSYYIDKPFSGGRSSTQTCVFKLWGAFLDPNITSYYGYAEIAERGNNGATTLVYTEKNRMIGAISALIRHRDKK